MLTLPKYLQYEKIKNFAKFFPEVIFSLQEQAYCTVLIILVYYGTRNFLFNRLNEKTSFQVMTLSRNQVLLLGAYVALVPNLIDYLPSWFLSFYFLLLSADIIFLFTSKSPGNEKLILLFKIACIATSIHHFLMQGMLTLIGALIFLSFCSAYLQQNFKRIIFLVFIVMVVSAVQSVKGNYRTIIFENTEMELGDRIGLLSELLYQKYFENDEIDLDDDFDAEDEIKLEKKKDQLVSGFLRAGDDSLEQVLKKTPSQVPFWEGETYESIPFMFIPRALWPDKPSRHFWNKYGRTYGIISTNDFKTSVGVSFLAEAYMNYGFTGLYFIAVFVGFLIVLVERMSVSILNGYYYFPYIVFVSPLLAPATDLGSMLSSLWLVTMVMIAARPFLKKLALTDEYA
jgi:hypothetical protein